MKDPSDNIYGELSSVTREKLVAAFRYIDGDRCPDEEGISVEIDGDTRVASAMSVLFDDEQQAWLCVVDRPYEGLATFAVADVFVVPVDTEARPTTRRIVVEYGDKEMNVVIERSQLMAEWQLSLEAMVRDGYDPERDFSRIHQCKQQYVGFLERVQAQNTDTDLLLLQHDAEFDDPRGEDTVPRDDTPLGQHMQLVDALLDSMTKYFEVQRVLNTKQDAAIIDAVIGEDSDTLDEPTAFALIQLIARIIQR